MIYGASFALHNSLRTLIITCEIRQSCLSVYYISCRLSASIDTFTLKPEEKIRDLNFSMVFQVLVLYQNINLRFDFKPQS